MTGGGPAPQREFGEPQPGAEYAERREFEESAPRREYGGQNWGENLLWGSLREFVERRTFGEPALGIKEPARGEYGETALGRGKGIEYEGTPNKASSLEVSINIVDYWQRIAKPRL